MTIHRFGGDWTQAKLDVLKDYLHAYTTALSKQPQWRKIYVDAFAGTGHRQDKHASQEIIPELEESEAREFLKGSATIALETEPAFDKFLFIEQKKKHALELEKLKDKFPARDANIEIANAEANEYLRQWKASVNWKQWRAVVFLDPYGMQVEWKTLETLAQTGAIDLWLLVPVGQAINRVLTTREPPPEKWAKALTRTFGTTKWLEEFYPVSGIPNLLGEFEQSKDANFERINRFFMRRLNEIFPYVANNPKVLYNSQNIPLFLLCFASANPSKGGPLAVKIAQDILKNA
jgi:three-Cys-motif partner protein